MGDAITTATASTYFSSAYGFQPPFDDVDVHGTYTMMMKCDVIMMNFQCNLINDRV